MLQSQLQQLQGLYGDKERQLLELQQQAAKQGHEAEEHQGNLCKQLDLMQTQLVQQRSHEEQLQQDLEGKSLKVQHLCAQVSDGQAKNQQLQHELLSKEAEVKQLTGQLADLAAAVQALQACVSGLQQQLEQEQQQGHLSLAQLEVLHNRQLQAAQCQLQQAQCEAQQLMSQATTLSVDLQSQMNEMKQRYSQQLSNLQAGLGELYQQLSKEQQQACSAVKHAEVLQSQLQQLQGLYGDKERQLLELQQQAAKQGLEAEEHQSNLCKQLDLLQVQLVQQRSHEEGLKQDLQGNRLEVQHLCAQVSEGHAEKQQLEQELVSKEVEVKQLTGQLTDMAAAAQELQARQDYEVQQLKGQLSALQADKSQQDEKLEAQTVQIQDFKAQLTELQVSEQHTHAQLVDKEMQLQQLQADKQQQEQRMGQIQQASYLNDSTLEQLQTELLDLQQQLRIKDDAMQQLINQQQAAGHLSTAGVQFDACHGTCDGASGGQQCAEKHNIQQAHGVHAMDRTPEWGRRVKHRMDMLEEMMMGTQQVAGGQAPSKQSGAATAAAADDTASCDQQSVQGAAKYAADTHAVAHEPCVTGHDLSDAVASGSSAEPDTQKAAEGNGNFQAAGVERSNEGCHEVELEQQTRHASGAAEHSRPTPITPTPPTGKLLIGIHRAPRPRAHALKKTDPRVVVFTDNGPVAVQTLVTGPVDNQGFCGEPAKGPLDLCLKATDIDPHYQSLALPKRADNCHFASKGFHTNLQMYGCVLACRKPWKETLDQSGSEATCYVVIHPEASIMKSCSCQVFVVGADLRLQPAEASRVEHFHAYDTAAYLFEELAPQGGRKEDVTYKLFHQLTVGDFMKATEPARIFMQLAGLPQHISPLSGHNLAAQSTAHARSSGAMPLCALTDSRNPLQDTTNVTKPDTEPGAAMHSAPTSQAVGQGLKKKKLTIPGGSANPYHMKPV